MQDKIEKLEDVHETLQNMIKNHADETEGKKSLERIKEYTDFRNSLISESDRGSVLMAAAYIEDKITQLLETYMVQNKKIQEKIFDGNGALATFSSKIDISFLLGLIPKKIYNDLSILRKLRNDFAHNAKPITFQTDYIRNRCKALKVVSKIALRDDIKAYFLRSMTMILTCINMKMDSFEQCKEEDEFNLSIFEQPMKIIEDIIK